MHLKRTEDVAESASSVMPSPTVVGTNEETASGTTPLAQSHTAQFTAPVPKPQLIFREDRLLMSRQKTNPYWKIVLAAVGFVALGFFFGGVFHQNWVEYWQAVTTQKVGDANSKTYFETIGATALQVVAGTIAGTIALVQWERAHSQREKDIKLREDDMKKRGEQFATTQQNILNQFNENMRQFNEKQSQDKALAEAKVAQDKALADAKAAQDKLVAARKEMQDQYIDIQNRFEKTDAAMKVSAALRLAEFATERLDPERKRRLRRNGLRTRTRSHRHVRRRTTTSSCRLPNSWRRRWCWRSGSRCGTQFGTR
jgi:hypothetical protein